ncbi:MAG: DUF3343 domain-containing protein [Anaerolineaceae bacterium]|mgnify:FL=1|nr:DUF3343 domain-containing protein [Anaerolineaceae bacterium]
MTYGIVLFHTTTSAIRSEKILTQAGLSVKLVPTPRELSSDCGFSLRFLPEDEAEVRQNLDRAGVECEITFLTKS